MCSASVKCKCRETVMSSAPECVEREQLEAVAFSGKRFLNLPLRSYQKVQDIVLSSQAQFLLRSLHRD